MERELFCALPGATQMVRACLRLAFGAFGSSYSSLLATVHLPLPPLLCWKVALAWGCERLAHFHTLRKSSLLTS